MTKQHLPKDPSHLDTGLIEMAIKSGKLSKKVEDLYRFELHNRQIYNGIIASEKNVSFNRITAGATALMAVFAIITFLYTISFNSGQLATSQITCSDELFIGKITSYNPTWMVVPEHEKQINGEINISNVGKDIIHTETILESDFDSNTYLFSPFKGMCSLTIPDIDFTKGHVLSPNETGTICFQVVPDKIKLIDANKETIYIKLITKDNGSWIKILNTRTCIYERNIIETDEGNYMKYKLIEKN